SGGQPQPGIRQVPDGVRRRLDGAAAAGADGRDHRRRCPGGGGQPASGQPRGGRAGAGRGPMTAQATARTAQLLPVPGLAMPRRPKRVRTSERILPSGLRVVAVRRPTVPIVEVRLWVPFFSTKPTHPARSALLAASMATGTANRNRVALATALGGLGAELSVGVDPDRLLLSSSALATGWPALLDLIAEVLTSARYPSEEVAGERGRMVERIRVTRSQAGSQAAEALARRLAPGHPYGSTMPDEEQVAATTAGQLRALHASMVRPAGAILVLVGDLSPARALDTAERALAGWTG